MKKNSVILTAALLAVLLAAVFVVYMNSDRKGPVITVNENQVVPYAKAQGEKTLLSYVKAVDEKDGDVTDTLIVESIYLSSDRSLASVIYAARDSHGNITKQRYVFQYLPTEEELASELKVPEETTAALVEGVTKATGTVGDSTVQETTVSVAQPTPASAEGTTAAGGPMITLTTLETTIPAGSHFNVMLYVKSITDDKDTQEILSRRVTAGGTFDTATPGDYTVEVYCRDTDGNMSNKAQLLLHVK